MHRRGFLFGTGLAAAASAAAQNATPRAESVESAIPAATPAIVLSQIGFPPQSRKTVVYRLGAGGAPP